MKFSPDGLHLLGGVGDGRIRLDGVVPGPLANFHAGGWDWLSSSGSSIAGQGSPTDAVWSLWSYNLLTGVLSELDPRAASNFFASGSNRWVVFLASRPPVSYDAAQAWADRVAFGMSPQGEELF